MYAEINRRQFLRGDLRGEHVSLRPPWSLPESEFLSSCSTCGDCVLKCPENILINGGGNYPEVDFQRGECTFCGDCVDNCSTNALSRAVNGSIQKPWNVKVNIGDSCLAYNRIDCLTCAEVCEKEAITIDFLAAGISKPKLDIDHCNGCGACFAPCPVNAINLRVI